MRELSARERKLIAIGLLVLLLMLLQMLVVAPLIDGFAARSEQRAMLRTTYAHNARLIDMLPALRRRADKQKTKLVSFAIAAPSPNLAGDRLKERLQGEFRAAGGEVTALQDVAASPTEVRAWVEGRLTLVQLQKLLLRIENAPPYLIVESLRISADRALQSGRLDQLDVRLEASIPYIRASS